jgi:replicative DNA helicase
MSAALTTEALLVGLALLSPGTATSLPVHPHQFGDGLLARAWAAIRSAEAASEPLDAVSLGAALGIDPDALVRLTGRVLEAGAQAAAMPEYASRVADGHLRRELVQLAQQVQRSATNGTGGDLLALVQRSIADLAASVPKARTLRDLAGDYLREWERVEAEGDEARARLSAPTGVSGVDRMLGGGFRLGQSHVLGAATSVGKSSLAIGCCLAASEAGHKVDLYGLEDDALQTFCRFCAQADPAVSTSDMVSFRPPKRFPSIANQLIGNDVALIDRMPPTLDELAWQMQVRARERGSTLVVLDYIQKAARKAKGDGIYARATGVSAAMFDVARDTGAAVLILSQRNSSEEDNRSLKGAGEIAEDAYSVLLLKRRRVFDDHCEKTDEGETKPIPVVEAHLSKNKNGPTGRQLLRFVAHRGRFEQADNELADRYRSGRAKP